MFEEKTVLRIPGPTPVPPEVTRAMTHAMIGHRSGDFSSLLAEVEANNNRASSSCTRTHSPTGDSS